VPFFKSIRVEMDYDQCDKKITKMADTEAKYAHNKWQQIQQNTKFCSQHQKLYCKKLPTLTLA
jgi:hypothetical protein